jgi:hypothetical protein
MLKYKIDHDQPKALDTRRSVKIYSLTNLSISRLFKNLPGASVQYSTSTGTSAHAIAFKVAGSLTPLIILNEGPRNTPLSSLQTTLAATTPLTLISSIFRKSHLL